MQPNRTLAEICATVAAHPKAWSAICDECNYIGLVALLEHPYAVVDADLAAGLAAAGIPRAETERLSLGKLVLFALTAPIGRNWAIEAVGWIEAGCPLDDDIAEALEQFSRDKRFPQPVRYRAFAAARRWRHGRAG